jgi:hypothetical protein
MIPNYQPLMPQIEGDVPRAKEDIFGENAIDSNKEAIASATGATQLALSAAEDLVVKTARMNATKSRCAQRTHEYAVAARHSAQALSNHHKAVTKASKFFGEQGATTADISRLQEVCLAADISTNASLQAREDELEALSIAEIAVSEAKSLSTAATSTAALATLAQDAMCTTSIAEERTTSSPLRAGVVIDNSATSSSSDISDKKPMGESNVTPTVNACHLKFPIIYSATNADDTATSSGLCLDEKKRTSKTREATHKRKTTHCHR